MKKLLLSFALVAFLCLTAAAQAGPPVQVPRPFDEMGDILISYWLARADNFAIELMNNPAAKGYIVAYGVPNKLPGWPFRRASQIKGYLVKSRGIDAERVGVVYGGYRDEVMYQLWIVHFAAALSREKTPFPFDQFGWFPLSPAETDIEDGYIGYLDERGRYEGFALALRSDPSLRGCVIAYAARGNRRGTDRRLAARIKSTIVTTNAIGAERVVALGGGSRPGKTVELWIVPPGSPLPKPTPTRRPTRPAHRKKR
ncbi:MAG: hypothetical protein LC802_14045 [Acidobacteria bacterium]|nr:hypothetical protein [Acidobacteriota bacterium]